MKQFHKKGRYVFYSSLLLLLSFISCKKPIEDNDPIDSNWLLPLVKGYISLDDLSRLEGLNSVYEISPSDFGQIANTPVSSPGIFVQRLGPYTIPMQEIIKSVTIDTLEIQVRFENQFPVTIDSGFKLILRTSSDTSGTGNIAYSQQFMNPIQPDAVDSITFLVQNATFSDSLYFYIENIKIDSFSNVVFNKNIKMGIELQKVRLKELALFSNKGFEILDTVSFEPGDLSSITDQLNMSDTSVTGHLNFFTDNNLPVNCNMQMTFLDNSIALDSVFDGGFVMTGATVDASGNPVNTVSDKNSIGIRKSKVKNMELSNRMIYHFAINTNGYTQPYVIIKKSNLLSLQIVGDIHLILNPFTL